MKQLSWIEYNQNDVDGTRRTVKVYTNERKNTDVDWSFSQAIVKLILVIKIMSQRLLTFSVKNALNRLFLPNGYPESVTEDYTTFERYSEPQPCATNFTDTKSQVGFLTRPLFLFASSDGDTFDAFRPRSW